jgi:hypothetical protein
LLPLKLGKAPKLTRETFFPRPGIVEVELDVLDALKHRELSRRDPRLDEWDD